MSLAQKKCVACEGFETPFSKEEAVVLSRQIKEWELSEDAKVIGKSFDFKNFAEALEFVNKVGALAEEEGHHPCIEFGWGKAKVTLTTHAINGLSENDFILAAKIDRIR